MNKKCLIFSLFFLLAVACRKEVIVPNRSMHEMGGCMKHNANDCDGRNKNPLDDSSNGEKSNNSSTGTNSNGSTTPSDSTTTNNTGITDPNDDDDATGVVVKGSRSLSNGAGNNGKTNNNNSHSQKSIQ
jgi:hypothetical protein